MRSQYSTVIASNQANWARYFNRKLHKATQIRPRCKANLIVLASALQYNSVLLRKEKTAQYEMHA